MAKKKQQAKVEAEPVQAEGAAEERVPFQIRFRRELHEMLRREAEAAGVSLNELLEQMCSGLARRLVRGRPVRRANGVVAVEPAKGCLFFGKAGWVVTAEVRKAWREQMEQANELSREEIEEELERDPVGKVGNAGEVWFRLNFSGDAVEFG